MDNIRIQTTQNVEISYEVASIGDRILATLLDYLFFLAYFLLVLLVGVLTNGRLFNSIAVVCLIFLPLLLYDLVCETFLQGMSFGKMIMKIKVVKVDGTQAGFGAYVLRWLLRIVDTRILTGVVALITILINGKGQRVGDIAAGTTVIKLKQKVQLNDTIYNKVKADYQVVYPQVSKLSDQDVAIIKEVVTVCMRTNNYEALAKVAAKTKAAMGIQVNLPDVQFLSSVIQDYNYVGSAAN